MSNTFHLKVSTPDGLLYDGDVVGFRARMIPAFRQEQDPAVCLIRVFREKPLTSGTTRAMMLATDEKE